MPFPMIRAGAQSATWLVDTDATFLGSAEWALLKPGKLKDLLNRTYLTPEGQRDYVGFLRAYAAAGTTTSTAILNLSPGVYGDWSLMDAGHPTVPHGTPIFLTAISGAYPTVVNIATCYSASE